MPGTASERQAIDRQDHNGADHRHDEPGRLSRLIHTEGSADPAAEQGSDDARTIVTIMSPDPDPA